MAQFVLAFATVHLGSRASVRICPPCLEAPPTLLEL
jgi:hypothetical protein